MTEWVHRGWTWVLNTDTRRYRITQLARNLFIVNRRDTTTNNLTQFGNGHPTLADAQAWVANDRS